MNTATTAIFVEGVGKRYRVRANRSSSLREAIAGAVRRGSESEDSFWSLRDAAFSVEAGEVVGLVGNNGAGKSTLLKMLSRITLPTEGSIRLKGRVGSLLEVGTGFHPELSGRDNVFMNGVLLGMTQRDIRRRFNEIVEFAGVEPFIDVPVKRYSSGMYLRLPFAVAAHLQADILLVDEVLAVGDIAFQKKCLARMDEVAHEGRTVLFVSHNLTAVQALCPRTIWIDRGRLVQDGATNSVLTRYMKSASETGLATERRWPAGQGPAAGDLELRTAIVRPLDGQAADPIDVRTTIAAEFEIRAAKHAPGTTVGFQLINEEGAVIFDVGPNEGPRDWEAGVHALRASIPSDLLNDGTYRIALHIYQNGAVVLQLPNLLAFDVLDTLEQRHGWYGKWHGVIRPRLDWRHEVNPQL